MEESQKKMIAIGTGVAVVAVGGYFGWQYWKKQKELQASEPLPAPAPSGPKKTPVTKPKAKAPVKPVAKSAADGFPLKKGSKGARVKTLQQALIAKYGKTILPRYGADGGFGTELVAALSKLKLPAQVNESTYNVLVQGTAPEPSRLAESLYKSASTKNFTQAMDSLRTMRSKEDYNATSDIFKTKYRIGGGVRQTLVTGVLNSFTDAKQKQQLQMEFIRMGLNFTNGKWSLSGIEGPSIITVKPTWVWKDKTNYVQVPESMVLGRFVKKAKQFIAFENGGRHFLVKADAVKRL